MGLILIGMSLAVIVGCPVAGQASCAGAPCA